MFYDQVERRQKFIHGRESASGISSVAMCPNKKYIAVAEKVSMSQKCQLTNPAP